MMQRKVQNKGKPQDEMLTKQTTCIVPLVHTSL